MREHLRFGGINRGNTKGSSASDRPTVTLAQLPAHLPQERIAPAAPEIATAHLRRIAPSACAADRQHRNSAPAGSCDDERLDRHPIHRVHHPVVRLPRRFQEPVGRAFQEKRGHRFHRATRVDAPDPLREHLHFGTPDLALHRGKLAVGVGDADIVHVDQRQAAHARTRQRLGGPGTDAAHADHRHVGARKAFQRVASIKTAQAPKAFGINRLLIHRNDGIAADGVTHVNTRTSGRLR